MNSSNQVIVPDFLLDNLEGELNLSLNQKNVPDLQLTHTYRRPDEIVFGK